MRIAFISDIHGNDYAFEKIIKDINRLNVDEIVFLGDAATLGPQPKETITRLRRLGCVCIRGNHDDYILNPSSQPSLHWVSDWFARQLSSSDLDFIRSFQPIYSLSLDSSLSILCYHGTPRSNQENLFASSGPALLDEVLHEHSAPIMVGGHTHVFMMRQHMGHVFLNAGSVGLPFLTNPFEEEGPLALPWAEYLLLDYADGVLDYRLRRIPVDYPTLKSVYLSSQMPEPMSLLRTYENYFALKK